MASQVPCTKREGGHNNQCSSVFLKSIYAGNLTGLRCQEEFLLVLASMWRSLSHQIKVISEQDVLIFFHGLKTSPSVQSVGWESQADWFSLSPASKPGLGSLRTLTRGDGSRACNSCLPMAARIPSCSLLFPPGDNLHAHMWD